jgi:hypothetical protein
MDFKGSWIKMPEMAMNMHQYAEPLSPIDVLMQKTRYGSQPNASQRDYYEYTPHRNSYHYTSYHPTFQAPADFAVFNQYTYVPVRIPTNHFSHTTILNSQNYMPEEIPFVVFPDEVDDTPSLTSGDSPASETLDSSKSDSTLDTKPNNVLKDDSNLEDESTQDYIEKEENTTEPLAKINGRQSIPNEKPPKVFTCTEKVYLQLNDKNCGKPFVSKYYLKRHLKIHSGIRPFKCLVPYCDKSFVRRDNMIHHSKNHAKLEGIVLPDDLIESTKVGADRFKFLKNSPFLHQLHYL